MSIAENDLALSSDEIYEGFERIRDMLYAEQPMEFDAVRDLIDLLQMIHCRHEWKSKLAGGDPTEASSNDVVTECAKCGLTRQ